MAETPNIHDLVLSILTSRPESGSGIVQLLFSQIVTALLPAIGTAGKGDAEAASAGTYVDEATDSVLTPVADEEGPRLNIVEWGVRCADVLAHWLNYLSACPAAFRR
ncbi:hypothetical protein DL765_006635 [Monosporascus sp. GIB2]|nr:hypothetical protein DL765_006635 [Monosporascus sp. GIB2]